MNDALTLLRRGGVVGGGGAGFPTWKKLAAPAEILIINGAECEPLLKSDQFLMLHNAKTLVEATEEFRKLLGAKTAIIGLKDHYAPQIKALETALSADSFQVTLCPMPTVYPIGDEQAVVFACTGRVVPPQSLPGSIGCTVMSVSTTLNAWEALRGSPVVKRLVTVAGEVKYPGLYEVPIGTPLSQVLEAAGGLLLPDAAIMLGGPMMGSLVEDPASAVITKTCGGVLVFPPSHKLIQRARLSLPQVRNRAKSTCIQCRFCTDLCPRYLLGHPLYPHKVMRAFSMNKSEACALLCMECGICELYACPMGLSPRKVQMSLKPGLRSEGAQPDTQLYPQQQAQRAGRQVPSARLAAQLGITSYDMPLPNIVTPLSPCRVTIPLKQHIGAAATPVVSVGDRVQAGQSIGQMEENALGADIHASITGKVISVGDAIIIEAEVLP